MGRKSKAEERKPEILKYTYHAARKYGIAGLTLNKIASGMNVAPSLLSHYFKNKDDIILGLIDWMVTRYDESILLDYVSIVDPLERMEALLDARLWEFTRQVIDDRVWFDAFSLALRNETVMDKFTTLYRRDLETIMATLPEAIRSNPKRREAIRNLANTIIVSAEGLGYYACVNRDEKDLQTTANGLKKMIIHQFRQCLEPEESGNYRRKK